MAMAQANKPRSVPDPSIGVDDLMHAWQKWMKSEKIKDVAFLMCPKFEISWKTAVNVTWLTSIAGLVEYMLHVAPNGVLPSKKHKLALQKLCNAEHEGLKNTTKKTENDFIDLVDQNLRIAMHQFREMAKSDMAKARAFRKADSQEKEQMSKVISMMDMDMAEVGAKKIDELKEFPTVPKAQQVISMMDMAEDGAKDINEPKEFPTVPKAPLSWTAQPSDLQIVPVAHSSSSSSQQEDPQAIFKKVLAKHVSESVSPKREPKIVSSPILRKGKSFLGHDFDVAEQQLLDDAFKASPIVKGGLTQNQRINAANKKARQGRGEGRKNPGKEPAKQKKKKNIAKKPSAQEQDDVSGQAENEEEQQDDDDTQPDHEPDAAPIVKRRRMMRKSKEQQEQGAARSSKEEQGAARIMSAKKVKSILATAYHSAYKAEYNEQMKKIGDKATAGQIAKAKAKARSLGRRHYARKKEELEAEDVW